MTSLHEPRVLAPDQAIRSRRPERPDHASWQPLEDFDPASAYLSQLGAGSRRTMREALTKLARWASEGRCGPHELPWHLLRIEHTAALRSRLGATLAPATANKHLAALRGVLKHCWRRGLMSAEAYQRAIDLPPVSGPGRRRLPRLGIEEIRRLDRCCVEDRSPAGARDAALLALLYGAQLRRAEAVGLELSDYDPGSGRIRVRGADGRAVRRFAANEHARAALDRWVGIRGDEPGPLFNPVNKGGRIEARRLSEQAIYIACQKRALEAGLPPTSPEDLRRAVLDAGYGSRSGSRPEDDPNGPEREDPPAAARDLPGSAASALD
jgi:integrase